MKTLDNEFVPYQESLELNELGFDEPCFATIDQTDYIHIKGTKYPIRGSMCYLEIDCPTFSQAFRWFRDNHGLYYHIVPEFYTNGINFNWQIFWYLPKEEWTRYVISTGTMMYGDNGEYPTQEEAELACLIKLIDIVKKQNLKG